MYTPITIDSTVSPNVSIPGDAQPEDPLIAMADPAFDSRIAVISPGAIDIACQLIRHGYQTASIMRVDDRVRPHQADVVIIPQAADSAFIERAIPFVHRLLAPMGVVVLRLPADRSGRTAAFARQQMVLNGFTAIRVTTAKGETLLGAELPLFARIWAGAARMRLTRIAKPQPPAAAGLRGSMTALVTPFRGGRIDEHRLFALCEAQIKAGTTALILCGSTGEAASLSQAEQSRVISIAIEASLGRTPIVAGCAAPATEAAIATAAAASRSRAAALLCAPPPYSKPTQEGIIAHVRAVALATELPVILYDVPGRTGVAIADTTVARLFEAGLIVGLKDATADLARPPRLRARCGDGLIQLSGDDGTAAAHRAIGGDGCISVTANLVPGLCARMHRAWDMGDIGAFARLRDLLAPLHEALFTESNPIPVKAALDLAGLCEAEVRLPLTMATPATTTRLAALLHPLLDAEDEGIAQPRLSLVR